MHLPNHAGVPVRQIFRTTCDCLGGFPNAKDEREVNPHSGGKKNANMFLGKWKFFSTMKRRLIPLYR
jgi:hypothetical protein